MAWVIGHITNDELNKLRAIGWEDEAPPKELVEGLEDIEKLNYRAFFVDNDVFDIMTGPDWENGEEGNISKLKNIEKYMDCISNKIRKLLQETNSVEALVLYPVIEKINMAKDSLSSLRDAMGKM